MKNRKSFFIIFTVLAVIALFSACNVVKDIVTPGGDNRAPIADAGPDETVDVGVLVALDGSGSRDPNGDSLTFSWQFESVPSGSTASLNNPAGIVASFTPDEEGDFYVKLTVSDGTESDFDIVKITALSDENSEPIADAGPDQIKDVGQQVTLDGNGSIDPDGDILTYLWEFVSKPGMSGSVISNSTSVQASFTSDSVGDYYVKLTVSDGRVSTNDIVKIIASSGSTNVAPVAVAGNDQTVSISTQVTLDGTGSYDPNGDTLTYLWEFVSKPSGSGANISNFTSDTATFTPDVEGDYYVKLTVSDGELSCPDWVIITAEDGGPQNQAPVADAGNDQTVNIGTQVTLNGSGSNDPDAGDTITYLWQFNSKPSGSQASISNASNVTASFIPDIEGSYYVDLTVSDGQLPDTDTVLITADPIPNELPVADAGSDQQVNVGEQVQFDGSGSYDPTSGGSIVSWGWNFADGSTGSGEQPTHTYSEDGVYIVTLTVTDNEGAIDTDTMTVTVLDTQFGWQATGLWHSTIHRAYDGSVSWYYGQENVWNYATGYSANSGNLTSQSVFIPTIDPMLNFAQWRITEGGTYYDQSLVQVSTDGGSTWVTEYQSTDTSGTWLETTVDLSAYAGQMVRLRFLFDTVDGGVNNYEGWYVDQITLSGASEETYNIGNDVEFDGSQSINLNYLYGFKISVPQATTIKKIGIIIKSGGSNVKMALYSDTSNSPDQLEAYTNSVPLSVGINEIPVVSEVQISAGDYWIMAVQDVLTYIGADSTQSVELKYISHTFSDPFPQQVVSPSVTTLGALNFYIKVQSAAGGTQYSLKQNDPAGFTGDTSGTYILGNKFKVKSAGISVTELGAVFPVTGTRFVTLFDANTQQKLAQVTVSTVAGQWVFVSLGSSVPLQKDGLYAITIGGVGGGFYYQNFSSVGAPPFPSPWSGDENIEYLGGVWTSGTDPDAYPSTDASYMFYGIPDIGYTVSSVSSFDDSFERSNSTDMGSNWTEVSGDWRIESNHARSQAGSVHSTMVFSGADLNDPTVAVDTIYEGSARVTYVGLVSGFLSSANYVYVKVQDNNYSGQYNYVYFYLVGDTWSGMTGGGLAEGITPFTSARIWTTLDRAAGEITLYIDTDFDGTPDQTYTRGGLPTGNLGLGVGLRAYNDASMDNFIAQ